jgi:hypothetical protein
MPRRRPFAPRTLALAALVALASFGCSATRDVRESNFNEIQKYYTQLVRWAEFERAKSFVDPEALGEFQTQAAAFGNVRFTDYAIRGVQFGPDGTTATVQVTYYAYLRTALVAFAFDEQQQWSRPDGASWRVRSTFARREVEPGEGMF